MELTKYLAFLAAAALPITYGAPTEATVNLHPRMLTAMKRDFGLDAREAVSLVTREAQAHHVIAKARSAAGSSFAGAWLKSGSVHVGVTNHTMADAVRAAGATPVHMSNDLARLEKARDDLNQMFVDRPRSDSVAAASAWSGIASYHVDVASNKLVISSLAESRADAEKLAARIGLSPGEYDTRIVQAMQTPRATAPEGGDAYIIDGKSRCSIGFAVTTGFISAGHCGKPGSVAITKDGQSLGTFAQSIFPGSDMSYIQAAEGTQFPGCIDGYGKGDIAVAGSQEAAVGATVCRSGSTTSVSCGIITSTGVTVNYADGAVSGLVNTNACSDHGDSGGSFFAGNQAQGVLSGGSGTCSSGGETVTSYQPIGPILQNFGLTLVTTA